MERSEEEWDGLQCRMERSGVKTGQSRDKWNGMEGRR